MKKLSHLLLLVAAAAFIFTACEGPAGPEGPEGPQGPQGDTGLTGAIGPQGEAGTAGCIVCHDDSQTIVAKSLQYENSSHAMNDNAAYTNRNGCAQCHSSQGFREYIATAATAGAPYDNVQQPNCYTCHDIHNTYSAPADWTLTAVAANTLILDGTTFDRGQGNLCSNCHQARSVTMPVEGGANVTINNRFGTHHGPNANILVGKGMFEITGSVSYPTSNYHYSMISDGCVACHMGDGYGKIGGGHTMKMEYEVHEEATLYTPGCIACHTAEEAETKVTALHTEVSGKLATLEGLLITIGIYDPVAGLAVAGSYAPEVAGAYVNYQSIKEDKSMGVHNPNYVNALLDNTIAAMSAVVAGL
ncbi:MAG: hypothetical protein R2744_06405 [Bacteroidales bacterium]